MERRGAPAYWRSAEPSKGEDTLEGSSGALALAKTATPPVETLHDCITRHRRRIFPVARLSVRHHDHEYAFAAAKAAFMNERDLLHTPAPGADQSSFHIEERGSGDAICILLHGFG